MSGLDDAGAAREQHERFVRRVRETGVVWGLRSADGWCTSGSNSEEDRTVMPFWSERAYAARCAKEEWADYEPAQIRLDAFLGAWLPGMERDGHLVGTNWNGDLTGREVEPAALAAELGPAS